MAKCHQCGGCCRGLSFKHGNMLETELKTEEDKAPLGEAGAKEKALLRRIMIHKSRGKGSYGRGYQNYRCRMLWHNPFQDKWECLIYESRPPMCRKFEPGNDTLPDDRPCRQELSSDVYDKAEQRTEA